MFVNIVMLSKSQLRYLITAYLEGGFVTEVSTSIKFEGKEYTKSKISIQEENSFVPLIND